MSASQAHPFERLTPDVVIEALASVGLLADGRLQALSSYENRVYQAYLDDGRKVVVKFYRPHRWSESQILEEHSFARQLLQEDVPVVGPWSLETVAAPAGAPWSTLNLFGGFLFSVSPWRGGRAPELESPEVLQWIGRFLARLHLIGERMPFAHRPPLNVQTFARDAQALLWGQQLIPLDVQASWMAAYEEALELLEALETKDLEAPLQMIRVHGDCHAGNILWTPVDVPTSLGPGPHFVDLDDARMAPAVQDLWMLLSGDRTQRTFQLSCLLEGYEQFRRLDRRELMWVEPLRTLRLIHFSAWLAQRWKDPIFPINFPWFGSSDYWRGQVQMLIDQRLAMLEPALQVH
jgi:Ser/Thr protein kinase RdoA (MazF antagonist)